MSYSFLGESYLKQSASAIIGLLTLGLSGCDIDSLSGDDDDDDDGYGYVKFYNASANAASVYLNLEADDEDTTLSGVDYGDASNSHSFENNSYSAEFWWKNTDGDYSAFYEDTIDVDSDELTLAVLTGDALAPTLLQYHVDIDDLSNSDDLFSIRLINLGQLEQQSLDVYLSLSDETFNEAELIGGYDYAEMSVENIYEVEDYTLYITASGSDDVLYQSEEISFSYTSQYLVAIRDNNGPGGSPYIVDVMLSTIATQSYPHIDSSASFRVYNALNYHDLLPQYQSSFDLYIDGVDDQAEVTALAESQFSSSIVVESGDYSLDLIDSTTTLAISQHHLMTLNANEDNTVFVFLKEETEEDDDGNEEVTVAVNTMVVENSLTESVYLHELKLINLVDDYSSVRFYFVKSDETIDSATSSSTVAYADNEAVNLNNNTYSVYVVATEDSTDFILASDQLTLDETSTDLFVVFEEQPESSHGYSMTLAPQQ